MGRVSIKRQLGRPYRLYMVFAFLLLGPISLIFVLLIWDFLSNPGKYWRPAGFFGIIWVILCSVVLIAVRRLVQMDRHPDLISLARYGALEELLPQIETELADPSQTVQIGQMPRSFKLELELMQRKTDELSDAEVWITRSWLIYMVREGLRMQFFRLDSLILVYPEGSNVILADRFGVRLAIAGREGGRARLLAEILTRVPWALNRFDPETEKSWTESRQQIVAEVELRRRSFQQERPATGQ